MLEEASIMKANGRRYIMDEQDTEMECDIVFVLTISSLSQCSISTSDRHKYSKHQRCTDHCNLCSSQKAKTQI